MSVNYFQTIQKYFDPAGAAYQIYVPHVVLVTQLALKIARTLHLSLEQQRFIEEATMLHDIGIIKVNAPDIGCTGEEPYITHGILGREMLESEGLPIHALVCERHTGVGISAEDIQSQNLPLPVRDMRPKTQEEKIICYADKWYSKDPHKLWKPYQLEEILSSFKKFPESDQKTQLFKEWHQEFSLPL